MSTPPSSIFLYLIPIKILPQIYLILNKKIMKDLIKVFLFGIHILTVMYISTFATELMSENNWLYFFSGIIILFFSFYSVYLHIKNFYSYFKNKNKQL